MENRLERYGTPASPRRPLARVLRWCAELDASAAGLPRDASDAELVAEVLRLDLRRHFFMLEGLSRLYRSRFGAPIEKVLDRVKAMEDRIGAVDYEASMLEAALPVEFPKRATRYLERRLAKATAALAKRLRKRWVPDRDGAVRGVSTLVRRLTALAWDEPVDDRTYLCGEIASELCEIQRTEYDMAELEAGLHEFRRDVRWFPIYCTALHGFARLDDRLNPIPEYASLLEDPVASTAYAQLAASADEPEPVVLSRSLFIANTKCIADLGDLKDRGQVVEGLARALRTSGVERTHKKARARVRSLLGLSKRDLKDAQHRAEAVYSQAMQHRLFDHLAEPFVSTIRT